MLLDPRTFDLAPRSREVLDALGGDARFKLELPAAHLEIMLPPAQGAAEAAAALHAARSRLVEAAGSEVLFACAGVHPFTDPVGELNSGPRYDRMLEEYGAIARLQLVCALQVHVAVRGADRALAVYNGMRAYMPLVAAITANAPFYAGQDSGLASVRPKVCDVLPRQGVPPIIASWEEHEATLGELAHAGEWWYELRPHPGHGTLEIRVPDAQTTVADAEAVIAVVHALAAWMAERFDAGEAFDVPEDWVVGEGRWHACREGAKGELRSRVGEMLDALEPVAAGLGGSAGLSRARELAAHQGWERQRAVFSAGGARAVAEDLARRFLAH